MLIADRYKDQDPFELLIDQYEEPQSILYPNNINPYTEMILEDLNSTDEIEILAAESSTIEDFDREIFDQREIDPTRQGSFYYETMDDIKDNYEPVIFHNQTAFQSLATYYALIAQEILQTVKPDLKIVVSNHPLPITQKVEELEASLNSFILTIIFGLAVAFIPASIIAFIVKEKENNVKFQHVISGVSRWAYWTSNYFWDYAKYLVFAVFVCVFIYVVDIYTYTDDAKRYGAFWLIFLLYGLAVIPFTYATSFVFSNHTTAQVITLIFHFITGSFLPIVFIFMWFFDDTRQYVRD